MGKYFLTRRASAELDEIYAYSTENWGKVKADEYLGGMIVAIQNMADHPEIGFSRQHRSAPYLMAKAEMRHYVVYDPIPEGIIVVTIQHERRNVEAIIERIAPQLAFEVAEIRKKVQ